MNSLQRRGIREIFDGISLSVIQYLEQQPGVTNIQFVEREGASKSDIAKWDKSNHPHCLPEDFKSFLSISNGLLLRWSIQIREQLIPLGLMSVNSIQDIVLIEDSTATQPRAFSAAFYLDSSSKGGRVALVFLAGSSTNKDPQVWFQDLASHWHFISNTFTDYFRLMIMHLGLPHWQYVFTDIGLDAASKQWFRFLAPERLSIDLMYSSAQRGNGCLRKNEGADKHDKGIRKGKSKKRRRMRVQKLNLAKIEKNSRAQQRQPVSQQQGHPLDSAPPNRTHRETPPTASGPVSSVRKIPIGTANRTRPISAPPSRDHARIRVNNA